MLSAAAQLKLLAYAECEEAMESYDRGMGFDLARDVLHRHGWRMQENPRRFVELLRKEALALVQQQRDSSQDYVSAADQVPNFRSDTIANRKQAVAAMSAMKEGHEDAAEHLARVWKASPLIPRTRSG